MHARLQMAIKRDAADKWFSDCIRLRADYRCENCGRQYEGPSLGLHCSHIYGRKSKSVRWCADNALSLCAWCHGNYTDNPLYFQEFLNSYLGSGKLDLLREKQRAIFKTTAPIRKEIAAHYRCEFRRMESTGARDLVSYQ